MDRHLMPDPVPLLKGTRLGCFGGECGGSHGPAALPKIPRIARASCSCLVALTHPSALSPLQNQIVTFPFEVKNGMFY